MHSEVARRVPLLLSLESSDRGAHACVRLDVNPILPPGVALQGQSHACGESNGRAERRCVLSGEALMRAELGAAVSGEG